VAAPRPGILSPRIEAFTFFPLNKRFSPLPRLLIALWESPGVSNLSGRFMSLDAPLTGRGLLSSTRFAGDSFIAAHPLAKTPV